MTADPTPDEALDMMAIEYEWLTDLVRAEIERLQADNAELRGSTIGVARATKALLSKIEDRMKDSDIMRRIDSRSPIGDAWLDARDALARFERDTPIRMGGESAAATALKSGMAADMHLAASRIAELDAEIIRLQGETNP